MSIFFEPLKNLFEPGSGATRELLKEPILEDFKRTVLIGTPETFIKTDFNPTEGSDILVQKIDPKNALGYLTFPNEESYFAHLSQTLYEPTQEEVMEGTRG